MKIECIVTSYNYGDYLYYTLPSMTRVFDNVIVVTSETDYETIMACEKCGVEPVIVDPHIDGAIFNKAYMIDKALKEYVLHKDWVILTDADIYFEDGTKEKIESQIDNPSYLYGGFRRHAPSFKSFVDYVHDNKVSNSWERGEERFLIKKRAVIGFFQLTKYKHIPRFNSRHSMDNGVNMYPITSGSASHDDFYFQRCRNKEFLDVDVIHLSEQKQNWEGRITGRFDILPEESFADAKYVHSLEEIELDKFGLFAGKCNDTETILQQAKYRDLRVQTMTVNNEKIWWTLVC